MQMGNNVVEASGAKNLGLIDDTIDDEYAKVIHQEWKN